MDTVSAPVATAAPAPITTSPAPIVQPAPVTELNPSDAARALAARRVALRNKPAEAAPQEAAPEPEELAPEANAAPQEEVPSETTTETVEPAEELPPIDPPRSWTQAEKERFQSLPRETQEYLHTREQERDREFRRGQNEAAEQRKAVEAEQTKAKELQLKYEAKLAQVMQTIQETGPFSDIRSMADLEKLQAEDPFRFQAYQLHQWKLQGLQAELAEAESRKTQEQQTEWARHVQKESELASEYIPELADKEKGAALTKRVASELLPELGFKDDELAELANGRQKLSIFDHRVQRLLADALKLRDIKSAPKAVPQALPPVQRPGVSKPAQSSNTGKIQALEKRLATESGFQQARTMAEIRMLRGRR